MTTTAEYLLPGYLPGVRGETSSPGRLSGFARRLGAAASAVVVVIFAGPAALAAADAADAGLSTGRVVHVSEVVSPLDAAASTRA